MKLFLSTLSLRRATVLRDHDRRGNIHFYPRSPCGERRCKRIRIRRNHAISIHALLAESDDIIDAQKATANLFLSTLSLRRATFWNMAHVEGGEFLSTLSLRRATHGTTSKVRNRRFLSTLSLRRATDTSRSETSKRRNFYPRSPCGERPKTASFALALPSISIHALLAESDRHFRRGDPAIGDFYPRSPCGERLIAAI